jgi:hypothetical protein
MTLPRIAALLLSVALVAPAAAQTIKLGELNSYKVFPAFLEPYRKGMELAVEEVNAAGGVLGRKLELVVRDDNGNPGDAVRVAEELLVREGVAEGARNATIASLAGHLLWHGVDPEVVMDLLLAWNRARCAPPLEDDEVARVVASIVRLHQEEQGERRPEPR